jgi:DHA1 family bicyclomycin/chloramphenicol resistance-like MFS transporter
VTQATGKKPAPTTVFALALASIALIGPLAIHLFMPAIPAIKAEFGISDALAQMAFSVGLLTMAFSTLIYGSMSDRFGRRPVLLAGLGLFLFGSAVCAFAVSFEVLLTGRILQAMGAACGTTLVRSIARDAYGQENLVKAIAYLTMFYTMGPMVAPLAGGYLIDTVGWRAIFLFGLVMGGLIMLTSWLVIRETLPERQPRRKLGDLVLSHIRPFASLRFSAFLLQTGFSTGVFLTLATASAILMKEMLHRPAVEYGVYFLVYPVGFLIGNWVSSRMTGRVSLEAMVLAGTVLQVLIVSALIAFLLAGIVTPLSLFIPGFFITMAQGLSLPSTQAGAIEMLPQQVGTAAGLGVFVQWLIGALMPQFYGLIADGTVIPLAVTLSISTALCMICGAIPWYIAPRRK